MKSSIIYVLICSTFICISCISTGLKVLNNRPVIGILSQELSHTLQNHYPGNYTSYIAASYVKYLEGAGARVVPIFINQNDSYYEELFSSLNGILFPGGATYFNGTGYATAGKKLYDLAMQANQDGDYFPIWGTCLGFELLLYLAAGEKEHRASCNSWNVALPLEFKEDYLYSRLFSEAPDNIVNILSSQNVTVNFHHLCVTEKNFTAFGLDEQFKILSVNNDSSTSFISVVEGNEFPFYGTQFHPEKNLYEWNTKEKGIPHTSEAVTSAQYFGNFFVNEARKSGHRFPTEEEESNSLIWNHEPTYTGSQGITYEQCYLFHE